ncbi:cache domain-containing protein [Marinospirillum sp. MEB164]|uniref:diguanylate cyclase n=1 Tax=Marinospirillum alkalitolerans TaxID=3123374 RepID=A0ABW8PX39_9GAMM
MISKVGLFSIAAFIALAMISYTLYEILKTRHHLAHSYEQGAVFLVQNATSLLDFYYQRYQAGDLSLEAAQQNSLELISHLSYDDNNYFFIGNHEGISLANGHQDIVGTNILHLQAPDGRYIIQEIYAAAVNGGGFVEYLWPNPDTGDYEHKTSYVVQFAPWDWTLGTGINTTQLKQTLEEARYHSIVGSITIFLLFTLLLTAFYLFSRHLYTIRSRLHEARDDNPLTFLPGNHRIQAELAKRREAQQGFTYIYIDLDQFKAFNDVYGYALGDQILIGLAKILKKHFRLQGDFVGHIGGDDFVLITDQDDWLDRLHALAADFNQLSSALYSEEDRQRGGICALDRFGVERFFSLVSLSVSALEILPATRPELEQLAAQMTSLKMQAKNSAGSCLLYQQANGTLVHLQLDEQPQTSLAFH